MLKRVRKKISYIINEEGFKIFVKRFFAYLIFIFRTFFYLRKIDKRKYQKLRHSAQNNRVFLLGNGPSLNKTPLYLLKNEQVFCFNRFNLMFERLNYIPQNYVCIDDRVLSTIQNDIFEISRKVENVFLPLVHPSSGRNFYKKYKEISNCNWLVLNKFSYSLDLPYIGINKSVTNCALQIAAYMGFKEIYLVGVDMNYEDHKSVRKENKRDWTSEKDDDPNHFDPRYFGRGTKYHHPRLNETFEKWEEAKEFFERRGIKIYNATIGGNLEVFERVDFHKLFDLSEEEEMLLFLEKFNIKKFISTDLRDYFQDYIYINDYDNIFLEKKYIQKYLITTEEIGYKLIPNMIFDYIPYGPIFNQYLFEKRS